MSKKVVITGAGASGMVAGIEASKRGFDVTILEANEKAGKKIYATGNGKCNLTNEVMNISNFRGTDVTFIEHTIKKFGNENTKKYFKELGLMFKDKNGYIYPASGQASSVVYALENKCRQMNVKIMCNEAVTKVRDKGKNGFIINTEKGTYEADVLVVATGSNAGIIEKKRVSYNGYDIAKQYGHKIIPVVPALTGLKCKNKRFFEKTSGVRTDVKLSIYAEGYKEDEEYGELQLTDYGISGIPTFQLARIAGYALKNGKDVTIKIDFLPDVSEKSLYDNIFYKIKENPDGNVQDYLNGIINNKLIKAVLLQSGTEISTKGKNLSKVALEKIINQIKFFEDKVLSVNDMANAQVCAGGVSLKTINENMESLNRKGLFFTGEVLDADGKCGGYNLQWAWATGYIAGNSL